MQQDLGAPFAEAALHRLLVGITTLALSIVAPGQGEVESAKVSDGFDLEQRRSTHWAWQPWRTLPEAMDEKSKPAVIDHLIADQRNQSLPRLKGQIQQNPQAQPSSRLALLRRLSFALCGLPPTLAQQQASLAGPWPEAYERAVDEYLASPRFAEHWGRHWLDLVRYAETAGHEFDYQIPHASKYRDWVIRALDRDLPYDQFMQAHVAGDLMPPASPDGFPLTAATGFWHFHQATHGPVDLRQDTAERVSNQIDVLTKSFLGMTVACARCHDHKFDAIGTADFYSLSSVIQSSRRQLVSVDAQDSERKLVQAQTLVRAEAEAALRQWVGSGPKSDFLSSKDAPTRAELLATWPQPTPSQPAANAQVFESFAGKGATSPLAINSPESGFGSWFVSGRAFGQGFLTRPAWNATTADKPTDAQLTKRGIAHSGLVSKKLTGTLRSQTFILAHPRIRIRAKGTKSRIRLVIDGYIMDQFNALLFNGLIQPVETKGQWQWIEIRGDLHRYLGHKAWLEIDDPGEGWLAVDEIQFAGAKFKATKPSSKPARSANPHRWLQQARVACQQFAEGEQLTPLAEARLQWLLKHRALRDHQVAEASLAAHSNRMRARAKAAQVGERVLALGEGTPFEETIALRGDPHQPGAIAPRRFLQALGGTALTAEAGTGRKAIAKALASPTNPLPARVLVNRVWHHLFGRGIVATPDDLGVLGASPSHPQLLDYLSRSFVQSDRWSLKRLIKRIVMTETFRLTSSESVAALEEADPQSRYLHRQRVQRLTGEMVRDSMLFAAGLLDEKRFGPSVPIHLTPFMSGRGRPRRSGPLDGQGRRSIYLEVRRNFLNPFLLAFDFPVPDTTRGRRSVSNVPAQSLALMNDPLVHHCAKALGERVQADLPDASNAQKIHQMFRYAIGRPASEQELSLAQKFVRQRKAEARWTELAHVVFNLKAFLFVP